MNTRAHTSVREARAEPMDHYGNVRTVSSSSIEAMEVDLDLTETVTVISEDPDSRGHSMQSFSTASCPVSGLVANAPQGKLRRVEVVEVDSEARSSTSVHQHQQQQPYSQPRSPRGRSVRKTKQRQMTNQSLSPVEVIFLGVSETQSDSAISHQEIRSGEKLFYGAHVGSETRNMEFKRGGGDYLACLFRAHVRRYACAFLNSGGGSLMVGVDDDGIVRGIRCNHRQEDRARLMVDSILKFFLPPLLPLNYSLTFLPVVRPGPESVHLKVVRLTLLPPPEHALPGLYQTDQGEVFLRRDGSVEGPLSASAIQEWARQKWTGEVVRLQQRVETLQAEQKRLLWEIHHQSLLISSLCLNMHKSRPPDASEQLRQGEMPSDAGRCQCSQANPASSLVPTFSPTRMAPEWATVPSGPSYPAHLQCQQNGEKEGVPVSSICRAM